MCLPLYCSFSDCWKTLVIIYSVNKSLCKQKLAVVHLVERMSGVVISGGGGSSTIHLQSHQSHIIGAMLQQTTLFKARLSPHESVYLDDWEVFGSSATFGEGQL